MLTEARPSSFPPAPETRRAVDRRTADRIGRATCSKRRGEGSCTGGDYGWIEAEETAGRHRFGTEGPADGVEGVAEGVPGTGLVALGPEQGEEPVPTAADVTAHGQYGQYRLPRVVRCQVGYSSLRHARGSESVPFGVRSCRNE